MDEIEQLRSDLENAVLERDKALAELAQFRAVTITAVDDGDWCVEIDTNEWASVPLKVYVKDDHA